MVGVAGRLNLDVHGELRVVCDGAEELLEQLVVEAAGRAGRQLREHSQIGAPGDVDRAHRARLVHRHDRVAVAVDAHAFAERLIERLAEHDPRVLDGVVTAGLQIAADLDVQIEPAVAGQQVEHVVEKADARLAPAGADAVERQAQRNARLTRGACDLRRAAHGVGFSTKSGTRARIDSAWARKPSARAIGTPARASASSEW